MKHSFIARTEFGKVKIKSESSNEYYLKEAVSEYFNKKYNEEPRYIFIEAVNPRLAKQFFYMRPRVYESFFSYWKKEFLKNLPIEVNQKEAIKFISSAARGYAYVRKYDTNSSELYKGFFELLFENEDEDILKAILIYNRTQRKEVYYDYEDEILDAMKIATKSTIKFFNNNKKDFLQKFSSNRLWYR